MTDEQIYCKTPEGERALVQRTRLVQRNLRNVLILVDGVATVADLTKKLGDGGFLRASLAELVRGGFVETIEENRVRRGIDAASAPEGEAQASPIPAEMPPVSLPPQLESALPEPSRWPEVPEPSVEEALPAPEPMSAAEPPVSLRLAPQVPFWRRWFGAPRPVEASAAPAPPQPPEPEPARVPELPRAPAKVRIKPIRRGVASEPRMGWPSRLIAALLGLAALAVLAMVVFPYDRFRPQVEERASLWLGQAVTIGEIRFALTPRPGVTLERVRLDGEKGVVLGSVRVLPSPLSLFSDKWRLGTIVLERPLIDQRAVLALLDSRRLPAGDSIAVQEVAIEDAMVSIAGLSLEGISGTIELTPDTRISEISLRSKDDTLRLTGQPQPPVSLKLNLTSGGWRMPWRGGVAVESIEAEGLLNRNALRIDKFVLRALGGTITGSATVDWQQQVALSTQASYARMNLQRLLALVEPAARVQGDVSGKITLRANAPSFESAGRAVSGGGTFTLDRGSLEGFDLVEAVRTRSDNPIRGGATKLEDFSGSISLDPGNWRLSGLRGSSGVMSTAGYLHQAGGKIDGVMDVQLRGSANQVNVPVVISGSLADPMLAARRRGAPAQTGDDAQAGADAQGR
ncbi:MAG: hypothetical protein IPL03_02830 [Sterolibacteriaceae bacterium]|nr:hypothetical protein [Candidatus Methylophosphatis haderslevensis]